MGSYKNLGIITLVILGFLVAVVCRVNILIQRQLAQTGTLQPPIVEAPMEVKKESPRLELQPKRMVEGIIIEGQPPGAVVMQQPFSTSATGQTSKKVVYELSSDSVILIQ